MTTKNTAATIRKQQQHKECFILRRYEMKKGSLAGCVCHVVRSVKQVKGQQVTAEYQVWRYADGMVTCNCKATGECYHMVCVELAEMRYSRHVQPVVKKSTKKVAKPAPVSKLPVTSTKSSVSSSPAVKGTLNGNRAFSLPKSWAELRAEAEEKKEASLSA
jgi:hypothetical protein